MLKKRMSRYTGLGIVIGSGLLSLISCQTASPLRTPTAQFQQQSSQAAWQVLKGTPQPRYNLQANAIGDAVYVSGGFNDRAILNTFERFDPQTQSWSALPNLPVPRYIHTASVLNQQLYLIGGYNFAQKTASLIQSLSQPGSLPRQVTGQGAIRTVDRFDLQTGKWSATAPLLTERFMAMSASTGGKIYVAGGGDNQRRMLDSMEVYDPQQAAWTIGTKLPEARAWGQLISEGRLLYLIGGLNAAGQYNTQIDSYDPQTGKWQFNVLPPLPEGRAGFAAAWTVQGLIIAGGTNVDGFQKSTLLLKPGAKQWLSLADLEPGRAGLSLVPLGGALYAFGTDAWYSNNTLKLDLER